jgi:hypothetical protein
MAIMMGHLQIDRIVNDRFQTRLLSGVRQAIMAQIRVGIRKDTPEPNHRGGREDQLRALQAEACRLGDGPAIPLSKRKFYGSIREFPVLETGRDMLAWSGCVPADISLLANNTGAHPLWSGNRLHYKLSRLS